MSDMKTKHGVCKHCDFYSHPKPCDGKDAFFLAGQGSCVVCGHGMHCHAVELEAEVERLRLILTIIAQRIDQGEYGLESIRALIAVAGIA